MWFLYALTWVSMLIQVLFITLSVAAGLYYLAEVVEEFTTTTGKIIKYLIVGSTVVYVGFLLFEDLPLSLIVLGLITNGVYILVLKTFPYIEITQPAFVAAIALIFVNHYLAFGYFSQVWHPFSEVLAFFTICLWLVPFAFFVSLSANENVLPTVSERQPTQSDESDVVSNYFKKKSSKIGLLSFFKYTQDTLLPQRTKKAF
ncbi:unnamed protein product [Owenia fusiformis]|uniref:Protein TEX261 n=1 Tax=Owenia fusiformis TaxID=6347 RepID=A0A8J1TA43_OWEFU|nr:unnamed protein product [Owenia fusiformis]